MTGTTDRDIPARSFYKVQQTPPPPHSALFHHLSLFFPFPHGEPYLLPILIPDIRPRVAGSQELVIRVAPSLIPLPASQTVNTLQERAGKADTTIFKAGRRGRKSDQASAKTPGRKAHLLRQILQKLAPQRQHPHRLKQTLRHQTLARNSSTRV